MSADPPPTPPPTQAPARSRTGLFAIVSGVVGGPLLAFALGLLSWPRLGSFLASLPAWQRAGLGLLAGVLLSLPALLLMTRWARGLGVPMAFYLWTALAYTLGGLPLKGPDATLIPGTATFAHQATWYGALLPLSFLVSLTIMLPSSRERPSAS